MEAILKAFFLFLASVVLFGAITGWALMVAFGILHSDTTAVPAIGLWHAVTVSMLVRIALGVGSGK